MGEPPDEESPVPAVGVATGEATEAATLIGALREAVSDSGLFYESHLAKWLFGVVTQDSLESEPQNRLVGEAMRHVASGMQRPDRPASSDSGSVGANIPEGGQDGPAQPGTSAVVHAATVPIVRQQLDLLATGRFKWTGEAWPGAKLDWLIEQKDQRSGGGRDATRGPAPWRTRLALGLKGLGLVDAELTLTGNRLAVRILALPEGAQRLNAESGALRRRFAGSGIDLEYLSIRDVVESARERRASRGTDFAEDSVGASDWDAAL